jgi:N-acetylmuramoyl-L-alanine amidase
VAARVPSFAPAPRVEDRASRIHDPVKRLRYLRFAMAESPESAAAMSRHVRNVRRWTIALIAIPALTLVPSPMGTAETFIRERGILVSAPVSSASALPRIWRVEGSDTIDVYSNGLRIDRTFAVSNRPRASFPVFPLTGASKPVSNSAVPVGIVFHTTESLLAPFDEADNRRLRQLGHNLLEVVRSERAYHYVIDRFGRVFAVVAESDAANHAGNSLWGGPDGIYVYLNDSFLAVAFEGQSGAGEEITPAQIASARVLTEMLRSRYSIAAENCVTHAQVSVNPLNMRIGEHTDWGSHFPFAAVGLPDNYAIPLASIYAFGFDFDAAFVDRTGGWKGVYLAAAQVERQASEQNLPTARYRAMLQHRFKEIAAERQVEKEIEAQAEAQDQTQHQGGKTP